VLMFCGSQPPSAYDDNVDVEVRFRDGRRFGATFFTIGNVAATMTRWQETGECSHGLYFWATHPIIVSNLDHQTVLRTVEHLMETGEFALAFEQLADEGAV